MHNGGKEKNQSVGMHDDDDDEMIDDWCVGWSILMINIQ